MYGGDISKEIQLENFAELCHTAERYEVNDLFDFLMEHMKKNILNESNCLQVFDVFMRIGREDLARKHVRELIVKDARPVFASDFFTTISEQMLIDLLQIDTLNLSEIDLLKAVVRWVNGQLVRRRLESTNENRQAIFEPLKRYIDFSGIGHLELAKGDLLASLLPAHEYGPLLLHLINKENPAPFIWRTKGRAIRLLNASCGKDHLSDFKVNLQVNLQVNRSMRISFIKIVLKDDFRSEWKLSAFEDGKRLRADYQINEKHSGLRDGRRWFGFDTSLFLNTARAYELVFAFDVSNNWGYHLNSNGSSLPGSKSDYKLIESGNVFELRSKVPAKTLVTSIALHMV